MRWATTQRNFTIFTAILVAIPAAYAFQTTVGGAGQAGDFLLLVTLAVGIPSAYDEYWPPYDRTWKAVGWVLVACSVVTVEFTGLYLLGSRYLQLSPFSAAIGTFLLTDLVNLAWLLIR